MRKFGGTAQRLLGPCKIVEFETTLSEASPGEPVLRILLDRLLKYRYGFVASTFLIELECPLYVCPYQTLCYRTVVGRVFMTDGEHRQIVFPRTLLRHSEYAERNSQCSGTCQCTMRAPV